MTAISVALGTLIVSLIGILLGVYLRHNLPKRYFESGTSDTVKLATGVIATLAALTLGLLIASSKSAYDARVTQLRQIASGLILSDRLLTLYGGEAAQAARVKLRETIPPVVNQIWSENATGAPKESFHSAAQSEEFLNALYALNPQTEIQRALRARIVQSSLDLAHARLALFVQKDALLPPPLLIVLAFWFAALFAAYSMYAEINVVTISALFICAASVAGAMFLLFQMNNPFSGIMAIPRIDFVALLPPLS
jgi:hypothetical protein